MAPPFPVSTQLDGGKSAAERTAPSTCELPDVADEAAEGEAETGAAFQNAVRRMKPEEAAAMQTGITGIEPSIKVAGRTHRRRLAAAREIMRSELGTTKFATAFNLDLPAPEAPPPMPAWISTREIYTLAFAYSCPKPTDAEVETWCGYFPTAADDIRECAKFMRLDVAQGSGARTRRRRTPSLKLRPGRAGIRPVWPGRARPAAFAAWLAHLEQAPHAAQAGRGLARQRLGATNATPAITVMPGIEPAQGRRRRPLQDISGSTDRPPRSGARQPRRA